MTKTDTNTLSPCPFCGARAETDFIPEYDSYQIECSDHFGCSARVTRDSELGAIEAWNLRTPAPRNAPLYDPDDVAFPARHSADGTDALPPELTSIAAEEVAAVEVAALSGAAHKPLTEEQMHKDLAVLCKRIFNTRIGKACSNCDGGTYQSDNNGYGQFHRCSKCRYVPMWGEDGSEFGITAAQKGGQHGF